MAKQLQGSARYSPLESAPLVEPDQNQILHQLQDRAPQPGSSMLANILGFACFPVTLLCSWVQVNPNESMVVMSYGTYAETLNKTGLQFSNCWGRNTLTISTKQTSIELPKTTVIDSNGNPLIISAVLVYSIVNARKALLDVENVHWYVRSQAEASLKQTLSNFPYESSDGSPCLKTEAVQIGNHLCNLLQQKVIPAGAMITSFQLKEISYAPEIASGMLKRQQAIAILEARQVIVQGAVDIAADAVTKLGERGIQLNTADAARLVTNLLTVVCSESEAQPTIPLGVS